MNFQPDVYARLSSEPYTVALEICDAVTSKVSNTSSSLTLNTPLLLEAGKILNSLIANKLISSDHVLPAIKDGKPVQSVQFLSYISSISTELKAHAAKNELLQAEAEIDRLLLNAVDGRSGYELTPGDLDKIPKILSELEKSIEENDELSDEHKGRIAKRISELRGELSRKLTSLDRLYCLAIETQFIAHKYGATAAAIGKAGNLLWNTALRINAQTEGLATGDTPISINSESSHSLLD